MPTPYQLILLGLSVLLLAVGGAISVARLWKPTEPLRVAAKACLYTGLTAAAAVMAWHSAERRICPLNDNFAALLFLGVLLGLFVMYTQRARPLAGLDWFVMPIVILLLIGAAVFGSTDYRRYAPLVNNTWLWVHRVAAYGGAVAFALAAGAGAMYLLTSRRLRRKQSLPPMGSLERMEGLSMHSVTLGFALLTIGLVTGFVQMFAHHDRPPAAKLLLGSLSWVVYAVVLHAPINPRFRGRRAAMLSLVGFGLLIGTIVVLNLIPGGQS